MDKLRLPRLDVRASVQPRPDTTINSTPLVDWRNGLPPLTGNLATLRELRVTDAPALVIALTSDAVTRYVSPPPPTISGFERFIAWSERQRTAGVYANFGVVPHGTDIPVGLFHIRILAGSDNAEWGFALAAEYWGSGLFVDGARLAVRFAFEVLGVNRLEARAAVANGRANGALLKIGALHECVLRRALRRGGECHDQALWTILRDDWRHSEEVWGRPAILH